MTAPHTVSPHAGALVEHRGTPLSQAAGAVILLHGRGASAHDILGLSRAFATPGLAFLAPQASGHTWYPNSFMAPRASNEPWLHSALETVESVVTLALDAGLTIDRIALVGFSQGACLVSEFLATHPARYAAVLAFTGGLIGAAESDLEHTGDLAGTPVFLGSGDPDPHVPWSRVTATADVLGSMGAAVTLRRYPGRPHTVSAEELQLGGDLLTTAFASA